MQDGSSGMLVPPGDVDAMAEALEKVLVDDSAAQEWSTNARRSVEDRINWDISAANYEQEFLRLMGA